jgi:hypothetical protein
MERILWGVVATVIVGGLSLLLFLIIGYVQADGTNAMLIADWYLNIQFLASITTLLFSFTYFSRLKRPSQMVLVLHILAVLIFGTYFYGRYSLLRYEQQQVLAKYQEYRQALLDHDYQSAHAMIVPSDQGKYSVDDVKKEATAFLQLGKETSIYSVYIYRKTGQAVIVPNPNTSFWFRPSAGPSWNLEKVDTEWYVWPQNIDYFIAF